MTKKKDSIVTVKGTVVHEDLSGGVWEFAADDGNRYQMEGGDKKLYRNGQRATVSGEVATDAMGIGMMGPVLRIKSFVLD